MCSVLFMSARLTPSETPLKPIDILPLIVAEEKILVRFIAWT